VNQDRVDARLRLLPCVVCYLLGLPPRPAEELHHLGDPAERNEGAKVPLCHEHHQGPNGIHGLRRRGFVKATKISDVAMFGAMFKLFTQDLP
jgi:hypothetical protein